MFVFDIFLRIEFLLSSEFKKVSILILLKKKVKNTVLAQHWDGPALPLHPRLSNNQMPLVAVFQQGLSFFDIDEYLATSWGGNGAVDCGRCTLISSVPPPILLLILWGAPPQTPDFDGNFNYRISVLPRGHLNTVDPVIGSKMGM